MLRVLIVVSCLLAACVAGVGFMPLGTALKLTGAKTQGLGWAEARGTVLGGKLDGLTYKGKAYGSADLELQPATLLQRTASYSVRWSGPTGTGTGTVGLSADKAITFDDYVVDIDLVQFAPSAQWIERAGGRLKLIGKRIRFAGGRCVEAIGTATSDVLERNRDIVGTGWSSLTGEIRCEGERLAIPLTSTSGTGTRFEALLLAAPGTESKFEARIAGRISRPMRFALPLAGFAAEGDTFVYTPKSKEVAAAAP